VAGCLFEVSLPPDGSSEWRCFDPPAQVTLLSDGIRDGRRHFRFRAEAAGEVELRFSTAAGDPDRTMVVRVVPEADLA
jgi:hypothetical protein